ncbi:MAG: hypothetical protein QXS66_08100, partial [Thermoproteota archaeon]
MKIWGLLSFFKTLPVCLAFATIAYLMIAGLLFLLTPDIALLIVYGYPTARLMFAIVLAFLFLNMLLTLACSISLFLLREERIVEDLRKNSRKLLKGFIIISISNLASLIVIFSAGNYAVSSTNIGKVEALGIVIANYGAGLVASTLFAVSVTWLVKSLVDGKFWRGWRCLLSTISVSFLMLVILSAYGLTGIFMCFLLIPTVIDFATGFSRVGDRSISKKLFSWLKRKCSGKTLIAIILSIIILNAETPLGIMLIVLGEEKRFNEDRLKSLLIKAVVEGWSSGELANAIKNDPELSTLSNYDLSRINIERDDSGRVTVTIPLNAIGYSIFRKTKSKVTVYDVYLQNSSGEVRIGDKRYVPRGSRVEERTYGPFETLEEALAKETEVKRFANSTRIFWNSTLRLETRVGTRSETKYAIVPTVIENKYNVIAEYGDFQSACNHDLVRSQSAQIRRVEKQVWVESYSLELVEETTSLQRAEAMSRSGYVVEKVYKTTTIYIFEVYARAVMGMGVESWFPITTLEIEKKEFENRIRNGEITVGSDGHYYTDGFGGPYRLRKIEEKQEQTSEVDKYLIYRKIDTSKWETKTVYQVVVPAGSEQRKLGVDELPSYAKGFSSKAEAESSKPIVETSLKAWAEKNNLYYVSCEIEPYDITVSGPETVAKEVKQYYIVASYIKPIYDVYELKPYSNVWEETHYEEKYGWVFKGYVNEKPEIYDMATWIYSPEVSNWTSKIYLGLVTEWEAQFLTRMDPRYVAEKHNTTVIEREIVYYNVYNATWRLLYHYYKYVVHPFHEYLANGNISSSENWFFEKIGYASGEICSSTYRSSPSSLRIVSENGRGAWRQSFYFDAGGESPTIEFWYMLKGTGALAIKKPDGSAYVFVLEESGEWNRFLRGSADVFDEAGYYTISFVACEGSELLVDDASVHVGGYGEWVYQGDVEKHPDQIPPYERYEPFYKIEDKRLIGTFEESIANSYPTPPYIKEFNKRERASYLVDLYKLYYLEGGVVRYKVYHWEKYVIPVIVRKMVTGAQWSLVESGVEASIEGRVLIESNVPEDVVKEKYNDPFKYYLVPKIVDAGEGVELICQTLDEKLAKKYEEEGYLVDRTPISIGDPIRFEIKLLHASVEKNDLSMLGKPNTLKVAIANPTGDTLTYQVVLETLGEKRVEKATLHNAPVSVPEAMENVYVFPVAEPDSWLVPVPTGGGSYTFRFTVWIKRERETRSMKSEYTAYWPSEGLTCNFIVKVLRNGRLVAKYSTMETFQNDDLGKTIARHPFETIGGFLTIAGFRIIDALIPGAGAVLSFIGALSSLAVGVAVFTETGNVMDFLTYGPTGFIVMPIRALTDPTLDDRARCATIGALIGLLGVNLAKEISYQLYLQEVPEGYGPLLKEIEHYYGRGVALGFAKAINRLESHYPGYDATDIVRRLTILASKGQTDAREIAALLDKVADLDQSILDKHVDEIARSLTSREDRAKLGALLSLGQDEIERLAAEFGDDFEAMKSIAVLKKLGALEDPIFYKLADGKFEVFLEKNIGSKLFPDIREGQYFGFRLLGDGKAASIIMPYRETVLVVDKGFKEYYLFSLHESRVVEAVSMLGSLKIVPELTYSSRDVGFYYWSNGLGWGSAGLDGVKTARNTYFQGGLQQELVWSGDIGYVGNELNKLAFSTTIQGQKVLFVEGMAPLVATATNYLPALLIEGEKGLSLGSLALPSGDYLVLQKTSLENLGLKEGLVEITYPRGEIYREIYTGGSLQIPTLSYSSGAFVGVQAVETRIAWTGSINEREFYSQIASVSSLIESILGRDFAREFVETVLLSQLTDSQALDIANTLVKNLEWIKTLSEQKRIELVRRIAYYVKKGETAEEAIERIKKESEEYVKNLEKETIEFYNSISDAQLANEVLSLIKHIQERLGPEAARWLLDVLKRVYGEALASTQGNREYANTRLRSVVENTFRYPESITQGCALASAIVKELMRTEMDMLTPKYLFKGISVWSGGYIHVDERVEPGLYWIIAKEDEKILATWTWRTVEGSNLVHVASDKADALKGKVFDVEIYPYRWELYFPKEFDAYGYHFEIDPWGKTLKISRNGEVYLIPFNNPRIKESTPRGVALVVETNLRSTRYGTQLILEFFEKGTGFSIVEKSGYAHPIDSLDIRYGLIEI